MDTQKSLAASAAFYTGSILVDPCPPVLPLPLLVLAAAGYALQRLLSRGKESTEK